MDLDLRLVARSSANSHAATDGGRPFFDVFATDELRLIMQMLPLADLLRLAQCCRRLHAVADSDAAWRHQPSFAIALSPSRYGQQRDERAILLGDGCERIRSTQLLRHLPSVRVEARVVDFSPTGDPAMDTRTEGAFAALLRTPRLAELVMASCQLTDEQWQRLAASPLLRSSLASLRLSDSTQLPAGFLGELASFERLTAVSLMQWSASEVDLRVLQHLPHLKSVTIELTDAILEAPDQLAALQAAPVTELHVGRLKWTGEQFRDYLTVPMWRRHLERLHLRELTLSVEDGADGRFTPPMVAAQKAALRATFSALIGVRYLHVTNFSEDGTFRFLLEAVAGSLSLQRLDLVRVAEAVPAALLRTLLSESVAPFAVHFLFRPEGLEEPDDQMRAELASIREQWPRFSFELFG